MACLLAFVEPTGQMSNHWDDVLTIVNLGIKAE